MPSGSVTFDRAAHYYDDTRGFPPGEEQRVAELISRVGGWNTDSRVLEIAIGTGRIALPLSRHVRAIYGIDLSRPMMERLRAKQSGESIRLAEGDITRLPFKSGSMDGAVAVHVFHLVPDWQGALREVARVLRPGSILVHGRNEHGSTYDSVWDAINVQIPHFTETVVGAQHVDDDQFLLDEGWRRVNDMQFYAFSHHEAPQHLLDQLEQRMWSRTWRLTDDELARALSAARTAMNEHFGDPHREIEVKTGFRATAYLPPAN